MKNLPNFLVVGAAKSGTTSLFDYLVQHPDIFIPSIKECKYFSYQHDYTGPGSERLNKRLIKSFDDYKRLYDGNVDSAKAIGDISPDYMYYHEYTIPRIIDLLGNDVKIILILRNPVERAYSAYLHKKRELLEEYPFDQALELEEERMKAGYEFLWFYKTAGLYFESVNNFKKKFPNLKLILFDDLKANPRKIMKEVFSFLEVDKDFVPNFSIKNESGIPKNRIVQKFLRSDNRLKLFLVSLLPNKIRKKLKNKIQKKNLRKEPMDAGIHKELSRFYEQDIAKLESLINQNLSTWKSNT